MKWAKPMVEELDVSLTANGRHNSYYEYSGWLISINDSKADEKEDPEKTTS